MITIIRKGFKPAVLATAILIGLTAMTPGIPVYAAQDHSTSVQKTATVPRETIPITTESVERFADSYFSRPDVKERLKGALFLVVKDDKVLLNKGYGYADVAAKKPIDPDKTVFRMASISKVFTATAVMQLVEQGKIDLERDISKYMPGITIPNKTGFPLKVKHLLTHTTGYNYTDGSAAANRMSLDRYVKENIPTVIRKPGDAYRYDNIAFVQQGYIVQNVSKLPFETYMNEHIFKPLGMNSSDFAMSADVKANLAKGYGPEGKEIALYDNTPYIDPTGGLFSTGSDMAKYITAMLNGGKLGDKRILKEQTTKNMESFQHGIHPKLPVMSYGFESFLKHLHNGEVVIGKGGDLAGAHSWMWMLPEHKVGAMVIVNGEAIDPRIELFAAFMQQFYPDQRSAATAKLKPSQKSLTRFEGTYRNLRNPMAISSITAGKDGTIIVKDQMGTHKLKQLEALLFQDEQGMTAGFKEDSNGEINYFYYNAPDSFSEKLPNPKLYRDVPKNNPYASSIYMLRKLQNVSDGGPNTFRAKQAITRAEFIQMLVQIGGFQLSKQPVRFTDSARHPLAREIQTAVEHLGVAGLQDGRFEPNRAITRQEAASFAWRFAQTYRTDQPQKAKLSGKQPSAWARDAVQFVAAAKLYGPEVKLGANGAINYEPMRPMLRQEAAALLAKLAVPSGS
ncbi:serine hydrolase [Paenibacillus tuaregi]|uniref:serine hydrolase n=1 Tax=Paenibacillus tuaregi TaxID=1816681 RepID=UPI0008384815|nr:serine hydrolase [Paenibacillus tuaregi]